MDTQAVSAFLMYAVINAITPGPGNILAFNTMGVYGWKDGKRLLFGVFAGYYFTQICCAIFTFGLTQLLNPVMFILKYIGAAYIAWLAMHIAMSKPSSTNKEQKPSFFTGFVLQCVNVKILLFGITALTGYVVPYYISLAALIFFSLTIATIGSAATIIWCVFGSVLGRCYMKYFRTVNVVLASILVWCAFNLIFQN